MEQYTQSIIAMLAVINPVVCGAMLLEIQDSNDFETNSKAAIKAMLTVLIILVLAAFGGKHILAIFGISMDAFKIVGGLIIGFIGFQMLFGIANKNGVSLEEKGDLSRLIVFAASPGTIAMVITLATVHNLNEVPTVAIVGSIVAIIISILIILGILYMADKKKPPKQGIVTKFMGLIIAAMGLQFLLDGIKSFFNV